MQCREILHDDVDMRRLRRLQALNDVTMAIARERDLERVVQLAMDAATELSGAGYGDFFSNVSAGERRLLRVHSGAKQVDPERFGLPRGNAVFERMFRDRCVLRAADIRTDPRHGQNASHRGTAEGPPPAASYLAAPVVSATGEVHGGVFLSHDQPGVFDAEAEAFLVSVAAHISVAIDNFRAREDAKTEIERRTELAVHRLAAIVESSQDAIVAKDLDGIITNWNDGARRLFGYAAAEVIGKPVTILHPADRLDEARAILASIRRGERLEPYETVRQRKDGSLVDVWLTVSPIRGPGGAIVGASKIARDITDWRQAEERRSMLIRELHHRVKNSFALASSIVTLSARSAATVGELASSVRERLIGLSRAHELTLPLQPGQEAAEAQTSLHAIVERIAAPLAEPSPRGDARVSVRGVDVPVFGHAVTPLALLLNELASNAAKYGALSTATGRVELECVALPDVVTLVWHEIGGPRIDAPPTAEGFGSRLLETTVRGQLGGTITRHWRTDGLTVHVALSRSCMAPPAEAPERPPYAASTSAANM